MTHDKLRTGLIIFNTETNSTGMVIDWGVNDKKLSRYLPLPAYNKMADWVRVWISSGKTVEVWPLQTIRFNGSYALTVRGGPGRVRPVPPISPRLNIPESLPPFTTS